MRAVAVTLATIMIASTVQAGKAGDVRTESFRLLNRGVAAYKRGEFAEAVENLEKSADMALNSFRAHFYLGLALIGDRRYEKALEALEIALELDPTHLQALVALGDAHLKLGDIEEARAAYFRALRLRPEYPAAVDGLARMEESRADDDKAIQTYLRAISSDRAFAPAYTHLGDLFLRLNRFEEAVRLLEEAVEVRPDYAPGLNRLALAYGRLGLNNEAIATIQKAMQLQPNNPLHPATLGELQLVQGSVMAAEKSFLRALEQDAGLPQAREGLAEVARRRGQYALALGQVDLALTDSRVDFSTAQRLERYRERIEAEQAEFSRLEQRVEDGVAESEDYASLAKLYAGRESWEEAVAMQRRVDETPEQRERLAYMLFRAGHYRDAHEIYSELARSSESADLEINDGVALVLLGDDEAAAASFLRALQIAPDSRLARLYLGNAMLRAGRRDDAVVSYKAFLDMSNEGEAVERVRRILEQIAPEVLPKPKSIDEMQPAPEPNGGSPS